MKKTVCLFAAVVLSLSGIVWAAPKTVILATTASTADFMTSRKAQETIGRFGVEKFGTPLFFPDAGKNPASLGLWAAEWN